MFVHVVQIIGGESMLGKRNMLREFPAKAYIKFIL